jgi:F0F1-type ATP synthase membrane subunit c/vacuolar-type H+-ATPase subunit K
VKPLGEAAAPTWSSASADAGTAVGTGVAVGLGVLTASLVAGAVGGDAAGWQAVSTSATVIAISRLISTRPPPCY